MAKNPVEKRLNPEQLEAIRHGDGPLLIIAGAGTGKTTVITERIKWLIEKGKAQPGEILALTFTEKAAREMEERVDVALPYGYTQMWISTFHSFCDRVLKLEALHIGLDPNYHLMTEAEATLFLRKNLFKLELNYFRPLGNPTKFISGILQHFSRLKDEDTSPNQYLDWARNKKLEIKNKKGEREEGETLETEKYLELANAFRAHEELKAKEGVMDFADLISNTLRLFRERPNILKQYQDKFKYILVDEFQDTNFAQNQLAILLAGKKRNITVVGDDDQAIYRFRGAAVSNIIQFRENFPKTKVVVLTRNYRSTQEILDRAYALIQNNNPDRLEIKEQIKKKLTSERKVAGESVVWFHRDRVENEADRVAKEIKKLIIPESPNNNSQFSITNYQFKDVAILVRANNHSEAFTRALSRYGIPYQFLGPGQLFRQEEIKDLIAYLKVLDNLEDNPSLYRLLSMAQFSLRARDLTTFSNFAGRYNLTLFEVCELVAGERAKVSEGAPVSPFISDETKEAVTKIVKIIYKHLELLPKETAGQILYYFLEDSGLLKNLIKPESAKAERAAGNIAKFFDKLKSYEVEHEDASVHAVLDWIDISFQMGESPLAADVDWSENNAVNILTVHSAKGLEFPVVFLVNLVGQRFPTTERREQIPVPETLVKEILPEGDYHLEEERRLFYVGMTRARNLLYFTSADYYGEGRREKKVSPFVFEALGENFRPTQVETEVPQLSLLDWQKPPEVIQKVGPLKISYLSYSQIDTFELCPLHYKLKYLLRIETPPTPAQGMGTSLHRTLQNFYYKMIQGEKPQKKDLLSFLAQNWISEGYSSKKHEEESLGRAKRFLENFFETQYDPAQKPLLLEETFQFPASTIKVGGKIDRVDDLGGGKIEIIDYKSGANVPDQKMIDKDFQMTLYAMAATRIPNPPFGKKPEQVKLSFYYFEEGKKISTTRTEKDFALAQEKIIDIVHQIEASDFRCSGSQFCLTCEYKMLCNPGTVNEGVSQ